MNEEIARKENIVSTLFNCSATKELSTWKLQSLQISCLQQQLDIMLGFTPA